MFKNMFNTSLVRQIVEIVEILNSTLHASSVRVPADFPRRFAASDYTGCIALFSFPSLQLSAAAAVWSVGTRSTQISWLMGGWD